MAALAEKAPQGLSPYAVFARMRSALPKGRTLPPAEWEKRHRWMTWLLWAHAVGLSLYGLYRHASVVHAVGEGSIIAVFALAATFLPAGQRVRATIAALGLLSGSAVLVHMSGGFIEAHFHYFVVMVLLTLYEAWTPYLIAVAFVLLQHGTIGVISPESVYNHSSAVMHPWKFALIHAAFIAAAGGAAILAWTLNENVREELVAKRQQEEEASLALLQSERANQAKSEFLSRVSHELRTPLTVILGFTEILEGSGLAANQQGYVEKIRGAGAHLHEMIKDVLDIGRIEEGQMLLVPEALDAREVIHAVAEMTQEMAALRRVRLDLTGVGTCFVMADGRRLRQVLLNLVGNAIKYNFEGGRVTITTSGEGDGPRRISVTDTGAGIPASDIEKLFLPFERLDAARRGVEGTGLGLALSKNLVEAMGGEVGVESGSGSGSTFWVDLQAAPQGVVGATPGSAYADLGPTAVAHVSYTGARTVLYVEDTLTNVTLVTSILERRPSIKLVPVMQGTMALRMARSLRPDLILLDLHLPDIPGDEVLSALKAEEQLSRIPVVMISADANPPQVERLLRGGAVAYLTKPIHFERLLAVLDEHLMELPAAVSN